VTSVTHGTRIDLLFTMSDNTRATDKRQMAKAKRGESRRRDELILHERALLLRELFVGGALQPAIIDHDRRRTRSKT
jgi:hypothetical protein